MSHLSFTCLDCHQQFAWTEEEQEYYRQKNLPQPVYCLICRGKYKAKLDDQAKYASPTKSSEKVKSHVT